MYAIRSYYEELKKEVLSKIVAGDAICSLGYSEPGCGSDVFAAQTRATRDGDGWRIDGSKMFTSGANIAQYVLMLTRTNPDVPKHKGLTLFIVPLDAQGIEVQAVHTFQDERTNITYYDGVRVKDSYRRITSYNVCYTKLLRSFLAFQFGPVHHAAGGRVVGQGAVHGAGVVPHHRVSDRPLVAIA